MGQSAGRAVHGHLVGMRDGAGRAEYGYVLVRLRASGDPGDDPDRRHGRGDGGSDHHHDIRSEDRPDAAQHHAGGDFGPSRGRHRQADGLYTEDSAVYRADRSAAADPGILSGVRFFSRYLVCAVPLGFCILQCGLRPAGRESALCVADGLRHFAAGESDDHGAHRDRRHRLSDVGGRGNQPVSPSRLPDAEQGGADHGAAADRAAGHIPVLL